jgi:hypothetical protein
VLKTAALQAMALDYRSKSAAYSEKPKPQSAGADC